MKLWIKTLVVCVFIIGTIGALFAYSNFKEQEKLGGSRPWSELCELTDCKKFPSGHLSFVMTNGDVLYTKHLTSGGRCCGVEGKNFYDPDTDTGVVLDGVRVNFYDNDFQEMGVHKYEWAGQAEMFFASSEKILYGDDREITISRALQGPSDLSLDLEGMEPVTSAPDFLLFHQYAPTKSAFSVISRDPIFMGHRMTVNCGTDCNMVSFDFEEGRGKVGLNVRSTFDFQTIPGFFPNCDKSQMVQTCTAFSKNAEVYKNFINDISALYAFLKIQPDERINHVRD